jgi:hypothetical protein
MMSTKHALTLLMRGMKSSQRVTTHISVKSENAFQSQFTLLTKRAVATQVHKESHTPYKLNSLSK